MKQRDELGVRSFRGERAAVVEECASFVHDLWDNGIPAQEFAKRLRALAAQPAPPADGWRTMDRAPRDGQHIIVGSTQWGPPRIGHGFTNVHGWYCPYTHEALEPTHWQPLPAPLAQGKEKIEAKGVQ